MRYEATMIISTLLKQTHIKTPTKYLKRKKVRKRLTVHEMKQDEIIALCNYCIHAASYTIILHSACAIETLQRLLLVLPWCHSSTWWIHRPLPAKKEIHSYKHCIESNIRRHINCNTLRTYFSYFPLCCQTKPIPSSLCTSIVWDS